MRNTFINKLRDLAKENKKIFLIVGDLGFNVVEEFAEEFPDRFLNIGVAEQNMVGVASGLASEGFHVFIYSIANFPTFRCAEQIRNDIDYHKLPITIVCVGGGVAYGNLGYSHHAIQDYGLIRMFSNFKIAAPADPYQVNGVLEYLTANPQPSYLRLGKNNENNYTKKNQKITAGRWYGIEGNQGNDEIFLSTGTSLQWLKTKKTLIKDKDIYTLPIWGMKEKLSQNEYAKKYNIITSVEDHIYDCGFGSWLKESLSFEKTNHSLKNIALPSTIKYNVASQESIMNKMRLHN